MNRLLIQHVVLVQAILWPTLAFAGSGITYHGRLLNSDGTPVLQTHVEFKIQIRTPGNENCLMYQETHIKDLSQSNGVFAIGLNDGTAAIANSEPFTMDRVFQNRGTFSFGVGKCSGATTYTPNSSDGRRIAVEFNDGTFTAGSYEPLPTQAINFVPMAIESGTVGGFTAGSLLRVVDGAGNPSSISALSLAQHTSLMDLVGGTSTSYLTSLSPLAGGNLVNGSVTDAKLASGISAAKISGNIPGNAAGFTGSLAGDVTGLQGSTTVARLQGRNVDTSAPADGQVLKWDAADNRWEPAADANTGTIASITGTSPIQVSAGANPVVSVLAASSAQEGVVRLANDGDSSFPNRAVAANDSRLSDARTPTAHTHSFASLANTAGYMDYRPNNVACANGEVLKKTANGWECGTDNSGGAGGVTSVGVAVPAYMTTTAAITTAGDVTIGFASQSARQVFASPTSGAGAPTFRGLNIGDIFSTGGGAFMTASGACAAGEQLTYLSASDTISCQTYSLTSAQVTGALTYTPVNPTALANYLALVGGTMGGDIAMGGHKITGVSNVPFVAVNPGASEDGKSLRWNQTTGLWEWFAPAGSGNYITGLTGDITATGPGSVAATIANNAVTDAKINDVGVNKITSGPTKYFTYAPNGVACTNGQVLKKTANGWECGTDATGSGGITSLGLQTGSAQTFASGSAGTAPSINSAADVHTLNVPLASGAGVTSGTISKTEYDSFAAKVAPTRTIASGTGLMGGGDLSADRTLAVNVGTGANQIPQLNGSGKLDPAVLPAGTVTSNAVAGDVTGTLSASKVEKIQTIPVSAITPGAGQVLVLSGGTWTPTNFGIDDLRTNAGASQFASASCSASQTLTWSAITDAFTCSDIVITSANLAAGLTDAMWTAASGNVHRATGNVGIGTSNPAVKLDVNGAIRSVINDAAAATTIDWSAANVAYTSASCTGTPFTMNNMLDGASYTLILKGSSHSAPCTFTGSGVSSWRFYPANVQPTGHVVLTLLKAGPDVYISWIDTY